MRYADESMMVDNLSVKPIKGRITLGPRGTLELTLHLEKAYPDDIRKCELCKSTAVLV